MIARKTPRLASSQERSPLLGLLLATIIAGGIIGACRLTTHFTSMPRTELDGIAFLGLVYWVISLIGYFTARANAERKQRRSERQYFAAAQANLERNYVRRNSIEQRPAAISAVSLGS